MSKKCLEIPDDFIEKAEDFYEEHGYPLLEYTLSEYTKILICDPERDLELYDPEMPDEPPFSTYREYAEYSGESIDEVIEGYYLEEEQLDQEIDFDVLYTMWRNDSPAGSAYYLLYGYDFDYCFSDSDGTTVGELEFMDGPHPGSDYLGVTVDSSVTLSYLQRYLDSQSSGIKIRFGDKEIDYYRVEKTQEEEILLKFKKRRKSERPEFGDEFLELMVDWLVVAPKSASGPLDRPELGILRWMLQDRVIESIKYLQSCQHPQSQEILNAIQHIANFSFPSGTNSLVMTAASAGWGWLQKEICGEYGCNPNFAFTNSVE